MSWTKSFPSLAVLALLCGCTSPPGTFVEAIDYEAAKHGIRDAHVQHVSHHPELRVDDALEERLDHALTTDDFDDAKRTAAAFIDRAHALAVASVHNEIDRLDDAAVAEIAGLYFDDQPLTRGDILGIFEERTDDQAALLHEAVVAAASPAELHALLEPIRSSIEPPVRTQGRFGRMAPWLLFTIPSRMAIDSIYDDEPRGNCDVPFVKATVYGIDDPATLDMPHGNLLARYAPIIVQEQTPADAPYASWIDRIGTVGALDPDTVGVHTEAASVYAYTREVCINGRPHVQLTYVHWYPKHPALRANDPEAGHIDGVTLRVTLDADARPAIFETVANCGCYHRLYPADWLEATAAREYGAPLFEKSLSIDRAVDGRKDLILPNAVATSEAAPEARPVIRVRAGWHGIVDVGFTETKHAAETHDAAAYTLRDYTELEHLATPDGRVTSMFYDNGLVRNAQRPEGVYFTPAGILSAGQPRQRGTQLIHWEDWNFDDPHLFTRALRLPAEF